MPARHPPIILASASPRRQSLLRQLGLGFRVYEPSVDEAGEAGEDPASHVRRVALAKARAAARECKAGVIIAADTLVVVDGQRLGKPASDEQAAAMLQRLAGREHRVVTAVAVMDAASGRTETAVESTRVWFRPLDPEEIQRYVATGEPRDKAGAYGIQGLGAVFVERIEGCYFAVVGLPLAVLARLLARFGIRVV